MSKLYELGAAPEDMQMPADARKPFIGDDKTLTRAVFIIGAVMTVWKLYVGLVSNVIWEEGHFVVSGAYPALGYPDIPAGFPWLARLVTWIAGWHVLPLRLVSLVIAMAIPWGVWFLASEVTTRRNALWAALIALILPPLAMNGTVFYPEGALQLMLALMLGCLVRAIRTDEMKWWALTGVCAAVGLLVHFRFLSAGLAVVLYMLANREGRTLWRRPGVWITAGLAVLGLLPSLVYNAQHDWPAIQFHVLNRPKLDPNPGRVLGYIEYQFGVCTPALFVAALAVAWRYLTRDRARPEALLAWPAVTIFLLYGVQTVVNKKIMPHWPFMAYVSLVPLIPAVFSAFADHATSASNRRLRAAAIATFPVLAVAVGIAGTAYQWAWKHSAELPWALREQNTLKNEDWTRLEPALAAADARARQRFGDDVVWAANSHMSAVHMEFPDQGTGKRRFYTLNDPNDLLTRFVEARHDWGLDLQALQTRQAGKGVMLALQEPVYLYHEQDSVKMYEDLCRTFSDVEPAGVTSLPPYKMAVDVYTARVRLQPLAQMLAGPCPFFPPAYIAQPVRGAFIRRDDDGNYNGIVADPKGVTAVDVLIDGKVVTRARYGLTTPGFVVPDVLKYDPDWPKLEFDFHFPAGSLVPGEHQLSVRATRTDGTTFDSLPRTLYVKK